MTANPSIANPTLIPDTQQTVSEASRLKPLSLVQRVEEALRKAFGNDEEIIASSLRGF
jgi:hypothetical protein